MPETWELQALSKNYTTNKRNLCNFMEFITLWIKAEIKTVIEPCINIFFKEFSADNQVKANQVKGSSRYNM